MLSTAGYKGTPTYLVHGQICNLTELDLLVFSGIRLCPVLVEPLLEDIRRILGKVTATLSVERALVYANIVVKSDLTVTCLKTWVGCTGEGWSCVVCILGSIIRITMSRGCGI
jgi:hypothetical protein